MTGVTQAWVDGTSPNYGLLLRSTGVNGEVKFKSREEGNSNKRPQLCVTYQISSPDNQAPTVNAGENQTLVLNSFPANINLDAEVADDGLPNPPGTLATPWSRVSGPAR